MKRLFCLALAGVIATLTGCGPATPVQPPMTEPVVDARFATADGLLGHYNQLITGEPVDLRGAYALYYAESEKQSRIIDLMRNSFVDFIELQLAILERFGDDLPFNQAAMIEKQRPQRAAMTRRTDDRCQATASLPDGTEQTIRLVKIGERWWISGYTFEYDPAFAEDMRRIEDYTGTMGHLGPIARTVHARLDAGEFDSFEAVYAAISEETVTYAQQEKPRKPSTNTSLSPSG